MFLLTRIPKHLLVVISVVTVLLVGYVDWLTDPRILFLPFYLVPVGVVTWNAGRLAGMFLVFVCCAVRLVTDMTGGVEKFDQSIEIWNFLVGFLAFCVVVGLVDKARQLSKGLERMVRERTAALLGEIAERKRAEESQRNLALQLSEAEDTERARLAADIHDSIGQSLSVLKMNLGALSGPIGYDEGRPPGDLMESLNLIDEIIKQVRAFIFRIYPAILKDLGLVPTLQWYAEQFEAQAGTRVTVSESGERLALAAPVASYLFRAVKELLNNAAKHGQAKEVIVAVHWRQEGIRVVIDDDGRGFDPALVQAPEQRRGLGLAGIRERLLALNGHLTVESAPGQGRGSSWKSSVERENGNLEVQHDGESAPGGRSCSVADRRPSLAGALRQGPDRG